MIDPLELAGIRQVFGRVRPPAFTVFGPYRLVRHPIYFGWALMTFGTPLMTGTRLSFAVISTAYLMLAIPFEERGVPQLVKGGARPPRRESPVPVTEETAR